MTTKEQNKFCMDLMQRLFEDVVEVVDNTERWYGGYENHTRAQEDIKRLRRELMILSRMLGGGKDARG